MLTPRSFQIYFQNPGRLLIRLFRDSVLKHMDDEKYLRMVFKAFTGYPLNLDAPKTFNEKLQWLKLYDRKPIYNTMVDKYEVKPLVSEKIGRQYLIPTIGVWDSFDEIDFDALPNQFVLKCTHDSGGLVICRDKSKLDKAAAAKKIGKCLKHNYFWRFREWPYKDVKPRILAEQYMEDASNPNLSVYKIFNFGGEPKIIQVVQNDKTPEESVDYYDTNWQRLPFRQDFPNSPEDMPRPATLEEMLELAKKLSVGFPFVRTDFYEVNGRVYFSEFTLYSDAGMASFTPESYDQLLGSWIDLPGV